MGAAQTEAGYLSGSTLRANWPKRHCKKLLKLSNRVSAKREETLETARCHGVRSLFASMRRCQPGQEDGLLSA